MFINSKRVIYYWWTRLEVSRILALEASPVFSLFPVFSSIQKNWMEWKQKWTPSPHPTKLQMGKTITRHRTPKGQKPYSEAPIDQVPLRRAVNLVTYWMNRFFLKNLLGLYPTVCPHDECLRHSGRPGLPHCKYAPKFGQFELYTYLNSSFPGRRFNSRLPPQLSFLRRLTKQEPNNAAALIIQFDR